MKLFVKTSKASRRSLIGAMLAASQLLWLPPALCQEYPPEYRPPANAPFGAEGAPEELPGAVGEAGARRDRQLVVDVIIQGARHEEKVLKYIRTKKEFEYDPVQLQADVRRLVTSGQFTNVKTYLRNVQEGVVVIFEISEHTRIKSIEFLGNRGYGEKKLLKTVNLKVGDPLNVYEVEEGRRKLEEHYHSKGFPKAIITIMEGDKPQDQSVVYVISEGYLQRVSAVTFEGNTFASDGVLKTKVQSKPGILWVLFNGKFDRQKLDADVEKLTAYYRDFGYFRARVGRQLDVDESGKWVAVKFIVDEGPRYNVRSVSIIGNETMRSKPMLEALDLKNGKPYNRQQMDKDLALMRDLYGSQGRIFAVVEAEPRFLEEPGQLDLVYKIQEGEPFRVGQINVHIAGEFPHTRRNVVLNRMSLRPGDLIDIREIRNSERRLAASQLFDTQQTGGEPPKIVVRPPELSDTQVASRGGKSMRGQSPDDASSGSPPTYDVDVYLPPMPPEQPSSNPYSTANETRSGKVYTVAPLINETRRLPPLDLEE